MFLLSPRQCKAPCRLHWLPSIAGNCGTFCATLPLQNGAWVSVKVVAIIVDERPFKIHTYMYYDFNRAAVF